MLYFTYQKKTTIRKEAIEMKSLKKALIGITTAMVLASTAVCTVAFAEEAPQAEESATKTFTTEDGVERQLQPAAG